MILLPPRKILRRLRRRAFLVNTFWDKAMLGMATPQKYSGVPATISGLRVWYAAWGETYANNASVDTFHDGSGNHYHATQTGSNRPVFKTSVINSQPAVYFDGSGATPKYLNLPDFFTGMTAGNVFLILKGDTTQGTGSTDVGLWAMPATSDNENYPWTDGNVYDGFMSTARKSCGSPGANFVYSWHTYEVISVSGEYTAKHNSTQFFTTASNTVETSPFGGHSGRTLGRSSLGSGFLFQGWIAEMILYGGKLGSTDRSSIYTYINGKYGI